MQLIHGDCLEKMKDIPDNSIDLVLTDPPYSLGYDFENDELSAHRISINEAVECFYNDFQIRRNKSFMPK